MSDAIDLGLGLGDHQLVDSEGRRCGKVDDLELTGIREGRPQVAEILVGRRRPGVGAPDSTLRVHARDTIPWSAVVRADRRKVVVRDGTTPG